MQSIKQTLTALLLFLFQVSFSQSVKNTSFINEAGEKVLQLRTELPVGVEQAWQMFTNDNQLKKWIAPVAHIELKTGGYILTNYDSAKSISDSSSIKLPIIHFIDRELLTLKVILNNNFPESVKAGDQNLQEIIQFKRISDNKTLIISSMVGFGAGKDWETVYNFFVAGNIWTYKELLNILKK